MDGTAESTDAPASRAAASSNISAAPALTATGDFFLPGLLRRIVTWPARMPLPAFIAAASWLAAVLTLFFFCPRFIVWQAIDYPFGWFNPEVNRAVATLEKVEDPFTWLPHNAPINWRLFFPVLAHYSHMPRIVFLALPFVGCWLALATVCHIGYRETGSRWKAFLLTAVAATTSWFFVSTGWLSYFDSWYILGLLLTSFYRSYWTFFITCLAVPWIDERFAFMMPTVLILRGLQYNWIPNRDWKSLVKCCAIIGVTIVPYFAIRIIAIVYKLDPIAEVHVAEHMGSDWQLRLGSGLWQGFRAAWLLFFLFLWYASRSVSRWWSLLICPVVCANLIFMMRVVNGDHSRTVSISLPVIVMGALLLDKRHPSRSAAVLLTVLVLNLILPAQHVIRTFEVPIRYFYAEYDRIAEPPVFLQPTVYLQRGLLMAQQQKFDDAMKEFEVALQLDPANKDARINKAIILAHTKKYDEALVVLNEALTTVEDFPEAYYARGQCRETKTDYKGAVTDYQKALDSAKKEWGGREACERRYKELRRVGITPLE